MKKNAAPLAAGTALLACTITLTACGAQQSAPIGALPQQSHSLRFAAATPSPIPFTFQTVDDPSSTTNEVNAIAGTGQIVGTIGNGKASNPYEGYTSSSPYSAFQAITSNGAQGTAITGLSVTTSKTLFVGYVIVPQSLRGTWGYYIVNGIPGFTKDRKEPKHKAGVTELLGVNDSETAVGFYNNSLNEQAPFVLDIPTVKYIALKPPGFANGAEATGINDVGDIVGWVGPSSSATGFFERLATYYTLTYPGAKATEALGVNSDEQVVGRYEDASGNLHGFVLTNPTQGASGQVWQSVDAPKGAQGTVITGINASDDICGYYVDSSGVQHGFVAAPDTSGS